MTIISKLTLLFRRSKSRQNLQSLPVPLLWISIRSIKKEMPNQHRWEFNRRLTFQQLKVETILPPLSKLTLMGRTWWSGKWEDRRRPCRWRILKKKEKAFQRKVLFLPKLNSSLKNSKINLSTKLKFKMKKRKGVRSKRSERTRGTSITLFRASKQILSTVLKGATNLLPMPKLKKDNRIRRTRKERW